MKNIFSVGKQDVTYFRGNNLKNSCMTKFKARNFACNLDLLKPNMVTHTARTVPENGVKILSEPQAPGPLIAGDKTVRLKTLKPLKSLHV